MLNLHDLEGGGRETAEGMTCCLPACAALNMAVPGVQKGKKPSQQAEPDPAPAGSDRSTAPGSDHSGSSSEADSMDEDESLVAGDKVGSFTCGLK